MSNTDFLISSIALFLGSIFGWWLSGADGWPIIAPIIVLIWVGRWIKKKMTN